jgi:hypothetical protein
MIAILINGAIVSDHSLQPIEADGMLVVRAS